MRTVTARIDSDFAQQVCRVVEFDQLQREWMPDLRFLAIVRSLDDERLLEKLRKGALKNVGGIVGDQVLPGDVVVPHARKEQVLVLYRETDYHHALLLTNRCNSYCLMCSQPPTTNDDSWRVREAIEVLRHIRNSPPVIGLSGGEPLLLGNALREVIDIIQHLHSSTRIEILTNGRLLADAAYGDALVSGIKNKVSWLVPLYGHASFLHDFVVQAPGAFEETLSGLLTLQEHSQAIQLRIVLIEPVLRILPELCAFIGRNLPFVREVALMGCEPIGFALANADHCEINLRDWSDVLVDSVHTLRRYRLACVLMNMPHCALPRDLYQYAHRSISDWKNVYLEECESCTVKKDCAGLFAWHAKGWKPTTIRAITEKIA